MSHRSFRTALSMGALAAWSCSVYSPSDLTGNGGGGASAGGHGGGGASGSTSGGSGGHDSGGGELGGAGMAAGGGSSGTGPKGGGGGASGDAGEGGSTPMGGSTPTGGKSTAGAGGVSGGSGGGGAGGAPSGGAPSGGSPTVPPELIEDMEDSNLFILPNEERNGNWYTAADKASGSTASGPVMVGVTDSPVTGSTMAFHFKGNGSKGWGAQAAFDFVYVGTASKEPYDASTYKGISFYAKAAAATTVKVRLPLVATTEKATGSTCIPSSKSSMPTCEDHFTAEVALKTSWTLVSLDWTGTTLPKDFHQEGWGKADWDPSQLLSVQFAVAPPAATGPVEFWVDDISFNK